MKKTIIFSLICCTLFITGCGCGKKEKKLTCSYKDDTLEENFTINFKNDIAVSFDSTKTYIFNSEEEANGELIYFIGYDSTEVVSNKIIAKKHYDYGKDEKLTYDETVQMYSTYNCK